MKLCTEWRAYHALNAVVRGASRQVKGCYPLHVLVYIPI